MISWRYSFKEISNDLELARKKKQALDDLFNEGRISQSTYESLNEDLTGTITDIEARRKALAEKVKSKIGELEQQITVLEMFLANSEIEYAAGQIDEELHQRETNAFSLGLEATKQELNSIKEVVGDLMPEETAPPTSLPAPPGEVTEEPETEELAEEAPEVTVEAPLEPETASEEAPSEQLTEPHAETPFVEEPVETPAEMPVEEEAEEAVEEELHPSEEATEEPTEEFIEEATEEPAEETAETSETTYEMGGEPSYEEESTPEEEEYSE